MQAHRHQAQAADRFGPARRPAGNAAPAAMLAVSPGRMRVPGGTEEMMQPCPLSLVMPSLWLRGPAAESGGTGVFKSGERVQSDSCDAVGTACVRVSDVEEREWRVQMVPRTSVPTRPGTHETMAHRSHARGGRAAGGLFHLRDWRIRLSPTPGAHPHAVNMCWRPLPIEMANTATG